MKEHLTIAYITSRKEPFIHWFWNSLWNQITEEEKQAHSVQVIVVDVHHGTRYCGIERNFGSTPGVLQFVAPKPCVWQGEHRLTKDQWFAAANARNTALCMAPDGWVCYVDDLTVLMPGWLDCVREAMDRNYIVAGAYRKVKNLQVNGSEVTSYTAIESGEDGRWKYATGDPCPAEQGWLFGCSCAMPVEALLTINGWAEICDGVSMEDCCTGIVLQNAGYRMMYDRRMLTLESEEHHHTEPAMRREDWHFENGVPKLGGNGHDDCSHALLNLSMGSKRFEYDVGGGFKDIRELRAHILAGGEFPIRKNPEHHWYTKQLLSEI